MTNTKHHKQIVLLQRFIKEYIEEIGDAATAQALTELEIGHAAEPMAQGTISATATTPTETDKPTPMTQPSVSNQQQGDKPANSAAVASQIKHELDKKLIREPDLLALIRDTAVNMIPSLLKQKGKEGTALTRATVQAANKAGSEAAKAAAGRTAETQAEKTPTGPTITTEKHQ
jgi:hypothetical protein